LHISHPFSTKEIGHPENFRMPGVFNPNSKQSTTAASRPVSAFPQPSSVLAWPVLVARVVVVALTAALRSAE
jgi:hypothetical protein